VLVLLTVLVCVGCDQASKAVATRHLAPDRVVSLAGDAVRLQYAQNRGAFLSLGDHLPERERAIVLTGAVGIFLAGFLAYLLCASRMPARSLIACSLICGGGIGNLIDRVARSGYVVDFLNCGMGRLRTGIFNVADFAITLGVVMLVIASFTRRR
jgi:signal peptidase II